MLDRPAVQNSPTDWDGDEPRDSFGHALTGDLKERIRSTTTKPTEDWEEFVVDPPSGKVIVTREGEWDGVRMTVSVTPTDEEDIGHRHYHPEAVGIPEVLDVFRDVGKPAVATQEVADKTRCPKPVVKDVLEELETRGKLASAQTGGVTIWWVADDQDLLKGFGSFKDTDIPEMMRAERENLSEEWTDVQDLS